jgi:hypothetical protein
MVRSHDRPDRMRVASRALMVPTLVIAVIMAACGTTAATPSASSVATIQPATTAPATAPPATTAPASLTGSVAGCVPECLSPGGTSARAVPVGSYATSYFFAGAFTITLDDGWTVEDGADELVFEHPGPPDWFIFVWVDPYPVANLRRVQGVERRPAAMTAWLLANPTLIAKLGPATTVEGDIPAVTIDLSVSSKATREVADCPDICTNYLGFENGPDAHGIARPGVTRIYFAPITYGGRSHLLTVSYEANDPITFANELVHAQQIIDTIRMPVVAAP